MCVYLIAVRDAECSDYPLPSATRDSTRPHIEVRLRPKLVEMVGFEPSALDDTMFGTDPAMCDVFKRRRPDSLWQYEGVVICVECDEKGGHGCRVPQLYA